MNKVPEGWLEVALAEVAEVRLGRQRSPDKATGRYMRPYMRAANVSWAGLDLSDVKEMNFEPREYETYRLRHGDVLLGEASGSASEVGKPAIWRDEVNGACFQNTLIRVRTRAPLSEYLYFHFLADARAGRFADAGKGVGINHLGADRMSNWPLRLPPLAEQRRIVAKLEDLLARSRRAKTAIAAVPPLLEKLRQSILAVAFRGDLTADWREENTDVERAETLLGRLRAERRTKWEEAELAKMTAKGKAPTDDRWKAKYKEAASPDTGELWQLPLGWTWASTDLAGHLLLGRRRAAEEYVEGRDGRVQRPYLRVANVKADRLDLSDVLSMPFSAEELTLYALQTGDVVLSEGQSPELVGQSAIFHGGLRDLCIQATVHRFRAYESATTSDFAQLVFLHHLWTGVFQRAAALTTNIAHLTSERLKPVPFPLPPLGEQALIVARVRSAFQRVAVLAASVDGAIAAVRTLESSSLAKAFRGELVPQDPNDEPAEVILARLKAADGQTTATEKNGRRARAKGAS